MTLQNNLTKYRDAVTECRGFISFAHQQDSSGQYLIENGLREFISESAFLKIFIAWESFLERCFVDYLMGLPSINNNRPAKWAHPVDESHAHKLLTGTQNYVDWANPEITLRLSKLYFHEGYVFFSQLREIKTELLDLKSIRNSAAHLSSSTSSKLDGLSSRLLNNNCSNFTAYKLLFSIDPASQQGDSILNSYLFKLDYSAEIIANG